MNSFIASAATNRRSKLLRWIRVGQNALRIIRFALPIVAILLAGCLGGEIEVNKEQLAQQQVQLDQLKQQIQALQTQQASYATAGTAAVDSCDEALMREATYKGGQRFATGDFTHALSYYQDAITACPQSARAHLNLARTYEAVGDRTGAIAQYKLAAAATGLDSDPATAEQTRAALARLH
jgi:tetratricopeptide (TPR) repeat protein